MTFPGHGKENLIPQEQKLRKLQKELADTQIDRNFTSEKPNTSWVAYITYIVTREGWFYLATIMDLYFRRIIGWSLRDRSTKELVIAALDIDLKQRNFSADKLLHSNRGSKYVSKLYQLLLLKNGMLRSMSDKVNYRDNAVMESFYREKGKIICNNL